jgi:PadR family transcriptional regulator, regulatory protein AphA
MSSKYASALSPEYALLGFLAQQQAHGYQLHQRLMDELGQVWHISLSQTYNILKRLENRGLITGNLQTQEKLPSRQEFHLTETGKTHLETWLKATSGSSVRSIRVEFLTRLYFASLLGPEFPAHLIHQQIAEVQSGLSSLERSRGNTPPEQTINCFSLDLRIRQLRTVLEWLLEIQSAAITHIGRGGR